MISIDFIRKHVLEDILQLEHLTAFFSQLILYTVI